MSNDEDFSDLTSFMDEYILSFKNELNGMTGINVIMVRDFILPTFDKKISEFLTAIDALPAEIPLIDETNSLQMAFTETINKFKTMTNTSVINLKTLINNALETEIDNIMLAKQQAVDALSENA